MEEWSFSAALLAGIARRALGSPRPIRTSVQFGKQIGAFQGIAHPLADPATDVDGARLLVWAIWSNARAGRERGSAMAWWWAWPLRRTGSVRAVHTFGGYGVSLEYDVQLYYRRATMLRLLAGDPSAVRSHCRGSTTCRRRRCRAPAIEIDFAYGEKAEAYAARCAPSSRPMTPEIEKKKHHSTSGHHPGFHKKMAEAGYAFPELSADGNPPRSRYEVLAAAPLWEDLNWTRVPSAVTEMVAKVAEVFSQPEAKQEILSRIIAGDALGCLGFSEPASGSDIFAAKFSAVRDGDDWVMNGAKMFTTNAHNADYIIMLTRTNNEGKKHEGLTMFVMPLKLPGVDIQPVYTLQDERTNIVYFGDVRVPDKYRIGEVDQGMKVMGAVLQLEHGGADYHYNQSAMLRHATAWARRAAGNGAAPIANPDVRRALSRAAVNDTVSEVLCLRAAWADVEGIHEIAWGPMAKLSPPSAVPRRQRADGARRAAIAAARRRPRSRPGRAVDASRDRHADLRRHQRDPSLDHCRARARHAEIARMTMIAYGPLIEPGRLGLRRV